MRHFLKYSPYQILLMLLVFVSTNVLGQSKRRVVHNNFENIEIHFDNRLNGQHIILRDSTYVNSFGETYSISKLRYYISNIHLNSTLRSAADTKSYLVDEANAASKMIKLRVKKGGYKTISFLLGVDSLHNVSGAQSGALDPLNDMFWTWNTGYVMAKFEGISSASALHNQIFEYHIGGFTGINNVLHKITLNIADNVILHSVESPKVINISAEINNWWHGARDIKISVIPSVTSPGVLAKQISDNYSKMFTIENIGH